MRRYIEAIVCGLVEITCDCLFCFSCYLKSFVGLGLQAFHNLFNKNTLKQSSLVVEILNVITWRINPFVIGLIYTRNIDIKNYSNLRI